MAENAPGSRAAEPDPSELQALRGLGVTADELGAAARGPAIDIPRGIDAAVRGAARARARRIRERRGKVLRLPARLGGAAAAAAVLVAAGLWAVLAPGPARETAPALARPERLEKPVASPMDVDGSGSVDIVDAFLMSRRLRERGERGDAPAGWDFDRDGEVGRGDVDAVALAAVSLQGRCMEVGR